MSELEFATKGGFSLFDCLMERYKVDRRAQVKGRIVIAKMVKANRAPKVSALSVKRRVTVGGNTGG